MAPKDAATGRSRIFISYRRADSEQAAARLADDLRRHFAPGQVFQDFASIDPGADFAEAVQRALDSCAAVLVVIGPGWLGARDKQGGRRLDLADDWVRHEVAESLKHPEVRVFPVLVGEADMPAVEDLPEPLRSLKHRQAFPLTVRHWANDVSQLVGHLKRVPGLDNGQVPKPPLPWKPIVAVLGSLAVLALLLFIAHGHQPGDSFRDCPNCPEMVVVPAGSYMMGSPEDETGRSPDEEPQHKVTIARHYAVGKYEVTFDEWDACVAVGGCRHEPKDSGWGRGRRPVINVSWEDAQAYVRWLSKKTGKSYRLLSEAEWEYAARAGTTTRYPWGDDSGSNRANFRDSGSQWGGKQTAPVGSFEPNAFGLHDMIGNALEWVQDCWNEGYQGAPEDARPWESGDCGRRVLRGASWDFSPGLCRSADRGPLGSGVRGSDLGFRLARTL